MIKQQVLERVYTTTTKPPDHLDMTIEWLQELLNECPEDQRAGILVDFVGCQCITLSRFRAPTEEETAERVADGKRGGLMSSLIRWFRS